MNLKNFIRTLTFKLKSSNDHNVQISNLKNSKN